MFDVLQIVTLLLMVLAMVPAVAHALELPGKLRLTKEQYFAVQPIYYPGFTIAGTSEPLAIVTAIILCILTPTGSTGFWLTLVSVVGLLGMQTVYWLFTHPVNNFWLQSENLSLTGTRFFSFASRRKDGREGETRPEQWTELRDRWEHSHVARAGLAALSLVALVVAISGAG